MGKFPDEMLEATISVLPKPKGDLDSVNNYRPISLINLDVKIYAKLIAERLKTILPGIVNNDQMMSNTLNGVLANQFPREFNTKILAAWDKFLSTVSSVLESKYK
ncbi:hemoglobin subunit alpha-like [Anomaloglossus baeobatrachus]